MNYIPTPLKFDDSFRLSRILGERNESTEMIDNLVELIAFTPKGTFDADPDFGVEYWNYEYSNDLMLVKNDSQESIRRSLESYYPGLKQVDVTIKMSPVSKDASSIDIFRNKVCVVVSGMLDDGLGVFRHYQKDVSFLIKPMEK